MSNPVASGDRSQSLQTISLTSDEGTDPAASSLFDRIQRALHRVWEWLAHAFLSCVGYFFPQPIAQPISEPILRRKVEIFTYMRKDTGILFSGNYTYHLLAHLGVSDISATQQRIDQQIQSDQESVPISLAEIHTFLQEHSQFLEDHQLGFLAQKEWRR